MIDYLFVNVFVAAAAVDGHVLHDHYYYYRYYCFWC